MLNIVLAPEARRDILEIYQYILERDGEDRAESVLKRLDEKIRSLATLAGRGKLPDELVPFGNRSIREIQEEPWRIFYRTTQDEVFVLSVLDGRRLMVDLLFNRLAQ